MSSGLDADVLVIGAGISGLTAATRLKKIDPELKVRKGTEKNSSSSSQVSKSL